jgi:NAD/NADP transhydrogenase beta subunit
MRYAGSVIVMPGYGLAVAEAGVPYDLIHELDLGDAGEAMKAAA